MRYTASDTDLEERSQVLLEQGLVQDSRFGLGDRSAQKETGLGTNGRVLVAQRLDADLRDRLQRRLRRTEDTR